MNRAIPLAFLLVLLLLATYFLSRALGGISSRPAPASPLLPFGFARATTLSTATTETR